MFGGTRGRLLPSVLVMALLGLIGIAAIAGCGEGEESTAKEEGHEISPAREPPKAFIKRMAKLLETTTVKKDCAQIQQINLRSYTRFSCPSDQSLRESMASFEVVDAEEYGTGAVVDYKSGTAKEGAAILLFVAPDRNWGVTRFGVITKPSTKTNDKESRDGYEKAIEAYLTAVRERDCDAFVEVAFTDGEEKQALCKTTFARTEELAKRLKADRSARPKYAGGNASYGFYTVETASPKPENLTISIVKAGTGPNGSYKVLDAAPSPTAADQQKVIKDYRRQIKEEESGKVGQPSKEPLSKPDDS